MSGVRRVVGIVQARMASSRLPGKMLEDIGGQPMLVRVVERARRARTLDEIVVATTTDPDDQALVAVCEARRYKHLRGHPTDVLPRHYQTPPIFNKKNIIPLPPPHRPGRHRSDGVRLPRGRTAGGLCH